MLYKNMAISPICNICGKELKKFGGLIFTPPDKKTLSKNIIFAEIVLRN